MNQLPKIYCQPTQQRSEVKRAAWELMTFSVAIEQKQPKTYFQSFLKNSTILSYKKILEINFQIKSIFLKKNSYNFESENIF